MPAYKPLYDRLNAKVDRSGGADACWLWTGYRNEHGYGTIGAGGGGGRCLKAHRVAWEQEHGQIPRGLNILHRCDNPACCNPRHLQLGSLRDNTRDMLAKGRGVFRRGSSSGRAVLTEKLVVEMRRRYVAGGTSYERLAREYGVAPRTAMFAIKGLTWKHVTT